MDLHLALMAGSDIPIQPCQMIMHQPSLKEISYVGEADFFKGVQTLCLNKTMFAEDKDVLENINNFQIFMTVINDKSTRDKRRNVLDVFSLIFPNYNVIFSPQSIIFTKEGEENKIIDIENFEECQDYFREIFCTKSGPMDSQSFNPANAQAKAIADKLMRGRQRVAAEKGEDNTSIFSRYLSILTIGLNSMTLQDLLNCTMYQLYDLIERYMLYINWDIDIKCRLAGGNPDSHPDDWMKNIH